MNVQLKDFQREAVDKLLEYAEKPEKEVILKAPTGSGKTIILSHFMFEFSSKNSGFAFVWLSIGKGELAEQSKAKMAKYFPDFKTGMLSNALKNGFTEGSATYINWEKITKKGNIAISESEQRNLQLMISKALESGIKFILIIDEQHLNNTFKATEIKNLFQPVCEVYASATPRKTRGKVVWEISESEVIASGLIKKKIVINEGLKEFLVLSSSTSDPVRLLLCLALEKQREILKFFKEKRKTINPLICVQIPNSTRDDKSSPLLAHVENYLTENNVNVDNGLLAFWLSGWQENKDGIEENDAKAIGLVFKQAIATGWDCPRAHILVKLRENMDDTFEVQTIGRIRRMPEAMHYDNDLADNCYVYTFDKEFIAGLSNDIYGGILRRLTLKADFNGVVLKKEFNPSIKQPLDLSLVKELVAEYYMKQYKTRLMDYKYNQTLLEANGYCFDSGIIYKFAQGVVSTIAEALGLGKYSVHSIASTQSHWFFIRKNISQIGSAFSSDHTEIISVLRSLFSGLNQDVSYDKKQLAFDDGKQFYAFVVNNTEKLKEDFTKAILGKPVNQRKQTGITVEDWHIPPSYEMPVDERISRCVEYKKNVYAGYLSSVAGRSIPEKRFERWCEDSSGVKWFYKNGEHNREFFSIVYSLSSGKQRHFFPDYILQATDDKIYILETKGGQASSGQSQNIDPTARNKHDALMEYIKKHPTTVVGGKTCALCGGFVRFDEASQYLLICTSEYDEDLDNTKVWVEIDKVIGGG